MSDCQHHVATRLFISNHQQQRQAGYVLVQLPFIPSSIYGVSKVREYNYLLTNAAELSIAEFLQLLRPAKAARLKPIRAAGAIKIRQLMWFGGEASISAWLLDADVDEG